jgi:carbonic anhydrase
VAGNVLNEDILGSIEFATQVSGAELILDLGHESCGAVKSAIDKIKLGHITGILDKIQPVIESSETFAGEKLSINQEYVLHAAIKNIEYTISQITSKSSIIKEVEENNVVKIVGGMYRLKTGEVTFWINGKIRFV